MNDIHIHGFHDTHVTIKWLKVYLYIVSTVFLICNL